jgi:hypothetical protein
MSPLAQRGKLRLNARPRSNDDTAASRDAPKSGRDRRQAVQGSALSWLSRTASVVGWLFSQSDVLEWTSSRRVNFSPTSSAPQIVFLLAKRPCRQHVHNGGGWCYVETRQRATIMSGQREQMTRRAKQATGGQRAPGVTLVSALNSLGLHPNVTGVPRAWCWTWESESTDRTTSVAVCGDVLARLAALRCLLAQATRARAHTHTQTAPPSRLQYSDSCAPHSRPRGPRELVNVPVSWTRHGAETQGHSLWRAETMSAIPPVAQALLSPENKAHRVCRVDKMRREADLRISDIVGSASSRVR